MSKIADATLHGLMCQEGGEVIDDFVEPGYPRSWREYGGGKMIYTKTALIEKLPCNKGKLELFMLFLEKYGGYLQHLKVVDNVWCGSGKEIGASPE